MTNEEQIGTIDFVQLVREELAQDTTLPAALKERILARAKTLHVRASTRTEH